MGHTGSLLIGEVHQICKCLDCAKARLERSRRVLVQRDLVIRVQQNGEVKLLNDEAIVLSHKQIGLLNKPHEIEELLADIRREIEKAWDVMNERKKIA